ncbi:unnamed protein product [Adineta ricciae]|uniref:Uncharacterized protein n=1 Tax=Adineta ricciae TaxID=249248 RepID=A0A816BL48_ADIRI|nr:unnamed protein product [Adineta ricciae]CAF1609698.1 unnamed protein product [Adineta ricciae]
MSTPKFIRKDYSTMSILLYGASRSGKFTFINALANYFHSRFIPNGNTLKIIDTFDFGVPHGQNQDDANLQRIFSYLLQNFSHLNALCILLKRNMNKLYPSLLHMLQFFDSDFYSNVFFCFTISDAGPVLRKFLHPMLETVRNLILNAEQSAKSVVRLKSMLLSQSMLIYYILDQPCQNFEGIQIMSDELYPTIRGECKNEHLTTKYRFNYGFKEKSGIRSPSVLYSIISRWNERNEKMRDEHYYASFHRVKTTATCKIRSKILKQEPKMKRKRPPSAAV